MRRSTVKRSVRSGLVLITERDSRPSQLYRFETRQDIQLLVKILGETAVADVRKRKPKLGIQLVRKGTTRSMLSLAAMLCEKRNLHGAPNTTESTCSMTGTH
jgi:hypothetical protein